MKSHRPASIPPESRDQPKRPIPPPPLRGGTWDVGQAGGPLTVRCAICKTRLSLDDGTHAHPHCRGAAPLTEPELARLVAALGDLLGARPLTPHQGPR